MTNDAHTNVGVTVHAEATTEDALRLSPSRRSTPPLRNDIPIPNPPRPEERPSDLFSEIKAYLEHRLSLVESFFRSEIALLKSDVARIESKVDSLVTQQHDDMHDVDVTGGDYDYDAEMHYLTPPTVVYEQFDGDHGEIEVEQQVETEEQPGQQQSETEVQQQPEFVELPAQQPRQEPILVRKRKPSHYISSPYTDPCRKTRYRRDKKLVYTPLRTIPKEKAEAFEKYLKSKSVTPIMCGIAKYTRVFFDKILSPHIWLESEVSHVFLY
ncbi:hypothetical protein TorRG33x02_117260 [Trema orientale]|uniref:Uncharacterized protein n=1 Tax=Trema orientale TaxID=63057 RepID=A0A2P5F3Q2_TREOI|nr:hypothetical protein TorRG33x02_117260 [Trema orientale]